MFAIIEPNFCHFLILLYKTVVIIVSSLSRNKLYPEGSFMNNKIIALVLIFAFIFMDCNGDDKTSPVIQKNSQEEKSVTSVSSQPNEATFNRPTCASELSKYPS